MYVDVINKGSINELLQTFLRIPGNTKKHQQINADVFRGVNQI